MEYNKGLVFRDRNDTDFLENGKKFSLMLAPTTYLDRVIWVYCKGIYKGPEWDGDGLGDLMGHLLCS